TIEPQNVQLKINVKILNDFQKLLGTINLVHPYLRITNAKPSPLFDLLKGDKALLSP
ncbi:POK8 protein, partial [Ramphastos sulfuratus]|nr:POK8 protein [Ramphastos sulfuratus]